MQILEPIYNQQTPKVTKHTEIDDTLVEFCGRLLNFASSCKTPVLAGLAANQLSLDGDRVEENVCFIMQGNEWITAVNPSIIKRSKEIYENSQEGCLTWPNKMIIADRHKSIVVAYSDLEGSAKTIEVEEFQSVVWQHEINHLNGIQETVVNPKSGKTYGPSVSSGEIIKSSKKIKPNERCPCDSGKKYKKCCGR